MIDPADDTLPVSEMLSSATQTLTAKLWRF
jgi:hypothetical protein